MFAPPAGFSVMTAAVQSASVDSAALRRAMVDTQLRTNAVNDPALVAALADTPREAHVPLALQAAAYTDRALPLGEGRALNPALTTARLIAALDGVAGRSVLLIGGATGYAAAVLARLGSRVTAVEEAPSLTAIARSALDGVDGVTLVEGPLTAGAAAAAPYDALMIDGAVEHLPAALLGQLADGAVIVTGMIDQGVTRLGRAVHVGGADSIHPMPFIDLECVRLPGFAPPPRFTF
jgi:protein-L-isoaspartate(D-aspartate) O-methyltransferase